jgi:hypothetical protein
MKLPKAKAKIIEPVLEEKLLKIYSVTLVFLNT